MKKIYPILAICIAVLFLAACAGNEGKEELDANDNEKAEAKVDESDTEQASAAEKDGGDSAKEGNVWTYYEEADAKDTFEDVTFNIQKVAVSDEAPMMDDNGEEVTSSAVGVKMQVENESDSKLYSTYPDQMTLVTSTGEQVEADMWVSDDLGGEIHEGVIKEGQIIFYLERGHAADIEWVKLTWSSSYEDPDGNYENDKYHDHEVKIDLKN
ncbi:hypothetical protein [Halobacillus karajensis]|uniref:DUF4352 domain-containing protein n=1 Tax=Halobacillus karajensis TaxID=195088 RepID=A0A059NXF7_9BACI|nr:hypothetical protein [Halobacillus karajensis]CDQ18505.1 hypothetical protein BN982_00778 [Halobacillus karajensis]CDQ23423.1 hypothetical protein BN983_01650 [Halobacillus karajensis]CDQ26905.1 hypothetical protein BN981_01130 [Halobacillus karajensis]